LRSRALRLLARREHSRHELRNKLAASCADTAALEALLDQLEQRGWMSEGRLVEQMLHTRGRKLGAARLLHELGEKKVSVEALERARAALRETELQRAREVWRKRFGVVPATPAERAKQARFLQSRGFALAIVTKLWRQNDSE
jgi:regulatory protein